MKTRFTVYFLILILIIGSIAGCSPKANIKDEQSQGETYVPVEIEKAAKRTIFNVTVFSGKVYPDKDVVVLPKVVGKVTSVNVKVGDTVTKDSILFTIDRGDMQKQVQQAKAALDGARANYELVKEQIENAKVAYERTKKLYEEGAVSKAQLEQAQLAASDESLEAAKTGFEQAQVAYSQALDALNDTFVKSPIDGVVSSVDIETGDMVSNTQPTITVVDMDKVYVQIDVTENIINDLNEGQEVMVNIPSASENDLVGKISNISPVADSRTQLYPIKIYIDNSKHLIKPGMFARVKINTDIREDVIAVKSEAVVEKNGKLVLYVVENDKAVQREVTTGLDTGTYVEIVEGLNEGENVIIKGQNYVEDGSKVKVVRGD